MFIIIVISLFVGIVTVPLYYSLWQMTSNDDWQVIWINTGKFYIFLIFNTTGRCFIWNDTVISFIPVCLLHFTFSKNSNSNLKLRSIVVGNFKTLTWIINNLHLFCYKFLWFTCNIKYLQLFQIVSAEHRCCRAYENSTHCITIWTTPTISHKVSRSI